MIRIVCVGKIKESFYTAGISEYAKRLSAFTKFVISEVEEENYKEIDKNIKEEGKNILNVIKDDEYVITCEINGKELSSLELAQKIKDLETYGSTHITFVIGGSNGLSDEVLARSNFALSFGKVTYPHQLMRLILSEQIYRAFMINSNHKYHK